MQRNEFAVDLTNCLLSINIPLYKLREECLIRFLEKYTKKSVPSETMIRSKYVPMIYNQHIEKMRNIARNRLIWVSLDETTDAEQRYIVNLVFGVLNDEREQGKSYLFAMDYVTTVNHETIAEFFDKAINLLGELKSKRPISENINLISSICIIYRC